MVFGPLGPSLAPWIKSKPSILRWFKPFAEWYAGVAGYRRLGLRYDDLIVSERDDVQRALNRLTPRESYDRAWRFKQASQLSVLHTTLPKDKWLPPSEDIRYVTDHIKSVAEEDKERKLWDTMSVQRKK